MGHGAFSPRFLPCSERQISGCLLFVDRFNTFFTVLSFLLSFAVSRDNEPSLHSFFGSNIPAIAVRHFALRSKIKVNLRNLSLCDNLLVIRPLQPSGSALISTVTCIRNPREGCGSRFYWYQGGLYFSSLIRPISEVFLSVFCLFGFRTRIPNCC